MNENKETVSVYLTPLGILIAEGEILLRKQEAKKICKKLIEKKYDTCDSCKNLPSCELIWGTF